MIPGVSPVAESSRAACKTCNFLLLRVLLAWLWPSYCVDFLNRVKKECAAGRKPFLSLFSARLYIIYCTQKSLAKNISFPAALASVIFVLGLLEGKSPDQVSLSAGNRNAFEVEFPFLPHIRVVIAQKNLACSNWRAAFILHIALLLYGAFGKSFFFFFSPIALIFHLTRHAVTLALPETAYQE